MRTYSTSEQRRPPAQAAEALRVAPIGWQRDMREFINGLLAGCHLLDPLSSHGG